MSDLLDTVIEAHGGLERWGQLDSVSARLIQGGAMWGIKGQQGVLDDVFVRASLHQERESHHPFGLSSAARSSSPMAPTESPRHRLTCATLCSSAATSSSGPVAAWAKCQAATCLPTWPRSWPTPRSPGA